MDEIRAIKLAKRIETGIGIKLKCTNSPQTSKDDLSRILSRKKISSTLPPDERPTSSYESLNANLRLVLLARGSEKF
jgi:hypothetical protein